MITRRGAIKLMGTTGVAVGAPAALGEAPVALGQPRPTAADVLAVVEKADRRLAFFDVGSGQRLSDVVLGDFPHELVADADRRFAYVGHYGVEVSAVTGPGGSAVFVVDLRQRTLVRVIDIFPFNRVHGMGMDGTGRLYALSEEKATLLEFDEPATATAPSRAVGTGGIKTHLFTVTRGGEKAYVTGLLSHTVSLVRPHDASVAPVVAPAGLLPESSCLSRDERTLFVGARRTPAVLALDAHSLRVRKELKVDGDPLRVYAVSDDQLLVTDLANKEISLISTGFRRIWTTALPGQPSAASLHPTEPVAYVSLLDTQQIAVLELGTGRITGSFATLRQPDASVLIPG